MNIYGHKPELCKQSKWINRTDKTKHGVVCTRCGLTHKFEKCRALSAMCNKCLEQGHFARTCSAKRARNTITKSAKQQVRDKLRMTEFVNRKLMELVFPFHEEDEMFYISCITNTSLLQRNGSRKRQCNSLSASTLAKQTLEELDKVRNSLDEINREKEVLISENEKLRNAAAEMESSVAELKLELASQQNGSQKEDTEAVKQLYMKQDENLATLLLWLHEDTGKRFIGSASEQLMQYFYHYISARRNHEEQLKKLTETVSELAKNMNGVNDRNCDPNSGRNTGKNWNYNKRGRGYVRI